MLIAPPKIPWEEIANGSERTPPPTTVDTRLKMAENWVAVRFGESYLMPRSPAVDERSRRDGSGRSGSMFALILGPLTKITEFHELWDKIRTRSNFFIFFSYLRWWPGPHLSKTEFLAVVSKMAILSQTVIFDIWNKYKKKFCQQLALIILNKTKKQLITN
jgi:hypothetical protein